MMPHLQRQKQQENYQHLRRLPDPPGILRYVYDDRNNNIDTIASYHNGNTNKYCNNENLLKKSSLSSPSNSRFRGLDPIATPTTTPTGRKASTEMFNDNYINQIVKEKEEELVSVSINTFKNSNNTKSTSSGKYGVKNIRMDSNHNDHNSYNIRYHHHNYNSHNDNSNTTDDSSLTASLSDTTMSSLTFPPAEQYHKHHENERIHDDMQSFTINDYSSDSKEIGQTGKFRTCSANVIKRSASWINAISHEPGSDNIIINKTHSKATGGVTPTTSDGPKQKILHDKNTIDSTVTISLNMVPTTPTTINKNSDGRLAGFDKNYFGNSRTTNNSNSETTSNSCSRSSCNNDTSINTTRQRSHWLPISTASGIVALASINGLYGDITTTNPTAATPVIRRCNNRLFYNIIEKGRNKNTQKETTTRSPPCGNSSKSSTSSRSHTARTNGTAATTTKKTETTIARHIARLQSYQYNEKYCRILFRNVIRCARALHQHDVIHCNLHIDNILIIDGSGNVQLRGLQYSRSVLDDDDYDDVDDDTNSNGNQSHEIKLSFPYFNWYSFHSPEIVIKSYLASNNRKNTNCSTSSSQSDSTDQNNNQCNKICNYNSLTTAVDIWSLGSILYMMLTGVPAFSHYESEQFTNDTVLCDNDYRNDPGIEEINFSAELDADYHHTECRNYVSKRKNIDRLFNNNSNGDEVQTSSSAPSSSAQKLILEMLQFNSYDRPTIEMILQSEWMTIDDTALEQYDLSRTKSLLSVWNLRKKHNSKTTADTTETQASTTTPSISSCCDGGFNNESSNASCLFDSNGNNIQPHSTSRIEI